MPTFTAIALDRLLEPGAPKPPNTNPEMRKSSATAVTNTAEKRTQWPQVSPSLYATPEATPLPDSPSSFPPSPYIINHKRRGPRLLKSFSQDDVSRNQEGVAENDLKVDQTRKDQDIEAVDSVGEFSFSPYVFAPCNELGMDGFQNGQFGNGGIDDGRDEVNNPSTSLAVSVGTSNECDHFFDPNETMSATTSVIEVEDGSGADSSLKLSTPMTEFFDACEELYSEGSPQYSLRSIEAELRDIRMNLLMEIEKRKQAEDALENMQRQWLQFMGQLSLVGLTVPATAAILSEDENLASDFAEELCQQVHVARVVSTAVGRGLTKAEIEMEMESQIEAKNFEIARMWDRLRYYEAVNHEMSQRNQEAIGCTQCTRLPLYAGSGRGGCRQALPPIYWRDYSQSWQGIAGKEGKQGRDGFGVPLVLPLQSAVRPSYGLFYHLIPPIHLLPLKEMKRPSHERPVRQGLCYFVQETI